MTAIKPPRRRRLLFGCTAFALILQGQTTPPPVFDAATVKLPEKGPTPGGFRMRGGPGTSDPGRITWPGATLRQLMAEAWSVEDYRVFGPSLIDAVPGYTITATMPPTTTRPEFRLMLQNLLIERFQIKLHHELRTFPGYDLVVAPGGPKLKESADPDAPDPPSISSGQLDSDGFLILAPGHGSATARGPNGTHISVQNYTITEFAEILLRGFLRQPDGSATHIVDKTGLTAKYDFKFKFDPRGAGGTVVVGPQVRVNLPTETAEDSGLPDIFKALEKQLGLKLLKAKAFPLDTIIIDHVEKAPTDN